MRPNRKQRRELAKSLGLNKIKKNSPFKTWLEMTKRAQQAGKQIHIANMEDNYNKTIVAGQEEEIKKLNEVKEDTSEVLSPDDLSWAQSKLQDSDWNADFSVE